MTNAQLLLNLVSNVCKPKLRIILDATGKDVKEKLWLKLVLLDLVDLLEQAGGLSAVVAQLKSITEADIAEATGTATAVGGGWLQVLQLLIANLPAIIAALELILQMFPAS
jgi:hypothetical protein